MISSLLLSREKYEQESRKHTGEYSTFEVRTGKQVLYYFGDNWLEYHLKWLIVESFIQGEVYSMISSWIFSDIIDVASSWKVILEFMERASHHSISEVEGLLHSISVMNVNVDIENPLECF